MPLDGIFLNCLLAELKQAEESRIEKIYQPSHDEFVFNLRGKDFNKKLLITLSGVAPRIHFTSLNFENPQTPPPLCMLVRKHFQSAKLKNITQLSLDRVLTLNFTGFNEMGDEVELSVIVEIMGRNSNIIFTANGKIIDSVRRTDPEKSDRLILPGAKYVYPQIRDKENILTCNIDLLADKISEQTSYLYKSIGSCIEGVSPLVAREITINAFCDVDITCPLNDTQKEKLKAELYNFKNNVINAKPYVTGDNDYCFMKINQYAGENIQQESFNQLLDEFYKDRQKSDTIKRKARDMIKLINSLTERKVRKIEKQKGELARCEDKEQLRIYGELLKANLYKLKKGSPYCEVENYYESPVKTVRIKLKPELSPSQNATRYFKEYKKAHTAEQKLTELIIEGEKELDYFESVYDSILRAEGEKDLSQIRLELAEQGYIRLPKSYQKPAKPLPPYEFEKDRFKIYVGRNNKQNDQLTLKTAAKSDIWLHTKNIHGSHTIIVAEGRQVPQSVIEYAASVCAYHSKAKQSNQVAVDYCPVKNVKKPNGAKPGMVIYDNYNTVYVTPKEI
ncbi:MAG: NFACT RNA binding domain-containing protein [Acutalibacteraceae bacterium]|nr:NFACT RNA binding domain-containing protein [Acutalibacteraceae bacterium]